MSTALSITKRLRSHESCHDTTVVYLHWAADPLFTASREAAFSPPRSILTMVAKSQRPKGRDGTTSSLNIAIEALNLAKEAASVTPAKAVFGSVSILLTMIKVRLFLSYDRTFHVHTLPGLDGQQSGLR